MMCCATPRDRASVVRRAACLRATSRRITASAASAIFALLCSPFNGQARSDTLDPVRITGYFDWLDGPRADGDYRSRQRDEFPELLVASKTQALVRAVTVDNRTTLRVLPRVEEVFANPDRWLFDAETSIPPAENQSSGGGLFDDGRTAAVIGSFGGGLYRVQNYAFPSGKTCATAQIDLQSAFADSVEGRTRDLASGVFPITCRDIVDVVGIGSGQNRIYVLFDGASVSAARREGDQVVETGRADIHTWLGSGDRRVLFARALESADTVRLAVAVGSAAGGEVCVVSMRKSDLLAARLPPRGCPEAPIFRSQRDRVIVEMNWRPDGGALAVLETDQRTRRSELSLVELGGSTKTLSRSVLVPEIINVPYVASPTLAFVDGTLYWLESAGRTSLVARYDGAQTVKLGLPEDSSRTTTRCGMANSWSSQELLAACTDSGDAIDKRASDVIGRRVTKDEAFAANANWFERTPAWISIRCTSDAPLVRVAKLLDVSWFVPLKSKSGGKTLVLAAVVANIAANGIDDFPYTWRPRPDCEGRRVDALGSDALQLLPPVQRLAVFEVPG